MNTLSKKDMLKLNLQMFAEESDNSSENTGTEDSENASVVEFTSEQQEHIDRLVAQAKSKGKSESEKSLRKEFETNQQKAINEAVQEALKKEKSYAEMSEEERKQAELTDREAALAQREAELNYKDLLADVKTDLASKGLPVDFAEMLTVAGDKEKSLDHVIKFEQAFKAEVAEVVKKQLQHPTATAGGGSNAKATNEGGALAKRVNAGTTAKPFEL